MTPSDKEAAVAVVTKDTDDNIYYLTVGKRDGEYDRWKMTEQIAKKIRRELNQLLD